MAWNDEPEFPIRLPASQKVARQVRERPAHDPGAEELERQQLRFGRAVIDNHGRVHAEMWPADFGKPRELWTEEQVHQRIPEGAARRTIVLACARAVQIAQGDRKRRT